MIFDRLANARSYRSLHPRIAQGLDYLQNLRIDSFEDRRDPIAGDALFALYQQYETRALKAGKWESHLRYADIQYIHSGVERMDVLHIDALGTPSQIAPERDVIFYPATAQVPAGQVSLSVPAGSFAIFFPQDGHRPNLHPAGVPVAVQKIVLKVLLEDA